MTSLPSIGQSANGAKHAIRQDSAPSPYVASKIELTPGGTRVLTCPATRSAPRSPSEESETTVLGLCGIASSVPIQDDFPWHKIDFGKYTLRTWSQGADNVSLLSPLNGKDGASCEVYQDLDDLGDVVPRYSAAQKGKWKVQTESDIVHEDCESRPPSPQFHFETINNSVEDWVTHTRPILQDYANRQTSLPLGRRLSVSIDEPPKFILGATQLLANRDRKGCTDRSRQLGPQLIENFVDIDVWAKEYFRSQHGIQVMDSNVPALLTIVMNNFYEGQVELIDRLVEFALEHMRFCGRGHLIVEDFAFGFDFKMSQDLPFDVETSSRIRKPLPIEAVQVQTTPTPLVSHSGRQIKLTERAKMASEQAQVNANGRRNKGQNTFQVEGKSTPRTPARPARQRRNPAQTSAQHAVQETSQPSQVENQEKSPPKTSTAKNRPVRPSNLGPTPALPGSSSTVATTPSTLDENPRLKPSVTVAVESPKASGASGSSLTVNSPLRLTIKLPPSKPPVSMASAKISSGSTPRTGNGFTSQTNSPVRASDTATRPARGSTRPRGPRTRGGGGRIRGNGGNTLTPSVGDPEIVPGNSNGLPTAHPANVGVEASAKTGQPVAPPSTSVYALRSTVGGTSEAPPHGSHNGVDSRDEGPSTPQTRRTRQPLQTPSKPGRSRGKKRKLDDCED